MLPHNCQRGLFGSRAHLIVGHGLLLALILISMGCVKRRLMIRSQPPGAVVYVDKTQVGVTPVAVNFIYYGTREVRLELDGYEPIVDQVQVSPPWYEVPPLDFFSENVVPVNLRDVRNLNYRLQPRYVLPTGQILSRGDQLRQAGRGGTPAGFPPVVAPSSIPQTPAVPGPTPVLPPAEAIPPGTPYPPGPQVNPGMNTQPPVNPNLPPYYPSQPSPSYPGYPAHPMTSPPANPGQPPVSSFTP
ncbi:PEGA domain-containing protein [Planctomycetales bacterium 10988]|nr:PEGA domain-containing protein [Planctomycetales bacterium 10988]